MSVLVVCAVEAERAALVEAGVSAPVVVAGVGPACAAAATAEALASGPAVDLVLCAGIGGGFAPLEIGAVAVASAIAFADLGAETPTGFVPMSQLGFGVDCYDVDEPITADLVRRTGGRPGTIVTVATATGSAASAAALSQRFPDVVAEGMEGAGVAVAASRRGVPFAEVRAVSNPVGPRDRAAWDVPTALTALGRAVLAVTR